MHRLRLLSLPPSLQLETYPGREQLASDLNLGASAASSSQPLLATLLQRTQQPPPQFSSAAITTTTTATTTATHASVPPQVSTACTVERAGPGSSSGLPAKMAAPTSSSLPGSKSDTAMLTSLTTVAVTTGNGAAKSSAHSLGIKSNGAKTDDHLLSRSPGGGGLAEMGVDSVNSSLDMEKLLNSSMDISALMKQGEGGGDGSGDPGRDELDDFFESTPLRNALDGKGTAGYASQACL